MLAQETHVVARIQVAAQLFYVRPIGAITYQQKKPQPNESTYNPEYVVINGKPIYDLEEAKELTMSSLNLLTSNVEKSVSSMENVKYLSIKF